MVAYEASGMSTVLDGVGGAGWRRWWLGGRGLCWCWWWGRVEFRKAVLE
jgi:hypothetical protein